MSGLLIVTVGNTDLQVLAEVGGHEARVVFRLEDNRCLHRWLVSDDSRYTVNDTTEPEKERNTAIIWLAECNAPAVSANDLETPLDAPLRLVPAKLLGIREAINSDASNVRISSIVVLNTQREEGEKKAAEEPIAAGPIISRWLAEVFSLHWPGTADKTGPDISGWVNWLDGRMRMEDKDGSLNRAGIAKADGVLKRLGDTFDDVLFALGGGMPRLSEPVRAAAQFRFEKARFYECSKPEGRPMTVVPAGRPSILPSESFRARQHARALLRGGDFVGAGVVAEEFKASESETLWARPLSLITQYLDGRLEDVGSADPMIQHLSDDSMPRCLLPGLRAEAALQSGDLRAAVANTVSFFDAALVDCIAKLPFVVKCNEPDKTLLTCDYPPQDLLQEPVHEKAKCLKILGFGKYLYRTGKYHNPVWLNQFDKAVAKALETLNRKLDKCDPSPRDVRHMLTHSRVPLDIMNGVGETFRRARVWTDSSFLAEDNVAAILQHLGIPEPRSVYRELVELGCKVLSA